MNVTQLSSKIIISSEIPGLDLTLFYVFIFDILESMHCRPRVKNCFWEEDFKTLSFNSNEHANLRFVCNAQFVKKNPNNCSILCDNWGLYLVISWPWWLWSYGSWIDDYLCNRCPPRRGILIPTLCYKICQWLAIGWWFSAGTPVPSNRNDHHIISDNWNIVESGV